MFHVKLLIKTSNLFVDNFFQATSFIAKANIIILLKTFLLLFYKGNVLSISVGKKCEKIYNGNQRITF
jgi:hypothetical protein